MNWQHPAKISAPRWRGVPAGARPDSRIDDLSPAEAIRAVMTNILYFAKDKALTAKVFDNAIALAACIPVRRLTFFPDARVWDMIGNEA